MIASCAEDASLLEFGIDIDGLGEATPATTPAPARLDRVRSGSKLGAQVCFYLAFTFHLREKLWSQMSFLVSPCTCVHFYGAEGAAPPLLDVFPQTIS